MILIFLPHDVTLDQLRVIGKAEGIPGAWEAFVNVWTDDHAITEKVYKEAPQLIIPAR